MKLVQITPRFCPDLGGVETHVGRVTEQLQKLGHQVVVVAAESELKSEQKTTAHHEQVINLPRAFFELSGWRHKLAIWKWWWMHRDILQSADVVHVHDVGWWIAPIMFWLRKPWYITFHGWETHWPIRWQAKLHRRLMNQLARRTIHIGAWIQEMYGDVPDLILYGATDQPQGSSVAPDFSTKETIRFVFIGRLEADNEISLYSEFLSALQEAGQKIKVTWVGDGSQRSVAEKIGLVTGFVADPQLYLAKADVVLANSYLSILSAQAHRKPVIACHSNYLKKRYLETLPTSDSMMLFSDVAKAVKNFQKLVSDTDQLVKKISEAQRWTQSHTWETVARAYLKLWETDVKN